MPILASPVGQFSYSVSAAGSLTRLWLGAHDLPGLASEEVERQLAEYFEGRRRAFDLRLEPAGTEFQRAVWGQLMAIPFGETRTYRQIATALGQSSATRAVGAANGANPIAIVIPCHRVIGSDGKLTGYAGGLDMKSRLLELEQGSLFGAEN